MLNNQIIFLNTGRFKFNLKMKHRKDWDSTQQDQSVHQLNDFERVQKKASRVSKNINAAREEWLAKQEALRQGKIPEELKKIIQPQPKKYTASAYAIA